MPVPQLLESISFNGFNLGEVLQTINQRIEVLLDRDHIIGHSYFMKVNSNNTDELQSVFQNCIIPLLQEYFYHDYEKIALILGQGFVTVKENKNIKFAFFKGLDQPEITKQFELIKDIDSIEDAVMSLLNKNE
jgi:5-methylcytosine-specific restriction endonuclease McrBC GTP-binding regulatory subunit McrB